MTLRRFLAMLLAAGLALTTAACSGDDDEDATSSTTTTEATDGTATTASTTTLPDDEYLAQVDAAEASLAEAGTDLCAITESTSQLGAPANATQVEATMGLVRATYEAFAGAIEADNPESAEVLRSAVDDLVAEAEAADYDPEVLNGVDPSGALNTEEFAEATAVLQQKYTTECAPELEPGTEGTTEGQDQPEG